MAWWRNLTRRGRMRALTVAIMVLLELSVIALALLIAVSSNTTGSWVGGAAFWAFCTALVGLFGFLLVDD